jgi:tripartite-type tricarboxylate transporter receptor subunit TctC
MISRRKAGMTLAALAVPGTALAQGAWPDRPIRLVTTIPPGGAPDIVARILAERLQARIGQPVVVENRTGAAGTLGMDAVAKAAPDGTTLGLVLNGNLVINPFIQKQMPFDAMKDLVPVAAIGDAPQMIALSTEVQAKTFKEFQALAKEKPGTYTYGSAGVGSLPHLSMAELARLAGLNLVHVPYRGNAPAMTDLLAGRIQLISASIGTFRAGLEAGKLRILLTATKNRLPYSPDVPASVEAGLPGYLMSVWIGVVAPAGTPAPMLDRIHAVTQDMMKEQAAKNAMSGAGLDPMPMSRAEFSGFVKAEYARWETIVKAAGVPKE